MKRRTFIKIAIGALLFSTLPEIGSPKIAVISARTNPLFTSQLGEINGVVVKLWSKAVYKQATEKTFFSSFVKTSKIGNSDGNWIMIDAPPDYKEDLRSIDL